MIAFQTSHSSRLKPRLVNCPNKRNKPKRKERRQNLGLMNYQKELTMMTSIQLITYFLKRAEKTCPIPSTIRLIKDLVI